MKRSGLLRLLLLCAAALVPIAQAEALSHHNMSHHNNESGRVGFGNTITVNEGESTGDLVCFFCTVNLHGDLSGDMVTFFSDVNVGPERSITGDAVVFGGKLALADNTRIGGNFVLLGGDINQAPSSTIHGDRVLFAGGGWLMVMLLPLLIPIGIIWLIVHIIRRNRYQFPAYPGGRRF